MLDDRPTRIFAIKLHLVDEVLEREVQAKDDLQARGKYLRWVAEQRGLEMPTLRAALRFAETRWVRNV